MSEPQGNGSDSSPVASTVSGSFWRIVLTPAPGWLGAEIGRLVLLLGLLGLFVFGLAGFAGDTNSPGFLQSPFFVKPILLFWWFCALVVTLQWEVLRHPAPRTDAASTGQQIAGLMVSIASIVFWTTLTFASNSVSQAASGVPGSSGRHVNQLIAILFNLWFVGVFWGDTTRRWIQWQREKRRSRSATNPSETSLLSDRSAWQRIGTDLMAAALLTVALTVFFSTDMVNLLAKATQSTINRNPNVDPCTVSVIANCDPKTSQPPLETLSGLDRLQAIVYFVLGAIVLGTFLLRIGIAGGLPKTLDELKRIMRESPRRVFFALVRPLQHVLWPVGAFVAIYFETVTALDIQTYLHQLSKQHEAGIVFDVDPQNYSFLGHAILFGALAPLVTVAAVVIMLYPWEAPKGPRQFRVGAAWASWLRALVQIGLSVMASFLIYSLALLVFNGGLIYFVSPHVPQPFVPPGVSTYVVFLALAILLIMVSWHGRRRRRRRQANEVRVAVREIDGQG